MGTLHDLVLHVIDKFKDRVAVIYDDELENSVITYNDLHKLSKQIATILRNYGFDDEIIGICMHTNETTPAILLGILQVPAAFYFFEPGAEKFILKALKSLNSAVVVVDISYLKDIENILFLLNPEVLVLIPEWQLIVIKLNGVNRQKYSIHLAYCISTSGSTGVPKIVRVPHKSIVPNVIHLRKLFNITSNDLIFLAAPLTFDPSIIDIFTSLSCGARLLITSNQIKILPWKLAKMLGNHYHVTVLQITPSLLMSIGPELLRTSILDKSSCLRILALGGEKFPSLDLIKKCRAEGNMTTFFNLYGITEVSCWSTFYQVTDSDFASNQSEIPLGESLSDTTTMVINDDGHVLSEGCGWLYTGSLNRLCFVNDEVTPENGLRNTGDLVTIDQSGKIFFLHRKDEQLKRNGKRLNLQEIEHVVQQEDFVENCKALIFNSSVILFYICSSWHKEKMNESQREQLLKASLQKELSAHYQPDIFVDTNSFPITYHGKLNIPVLYDMMRDSSRKQQPVEKIVEQCWKTTLKIHKNIPIDTTERFLAKGGDSLLAMQFINRLQLDLNLQLNHILPLVLHNPYKDILDIIRESLSKHKHSTSDEESKPSELRLSSDNWKGLNKFVKKKHLENVQNTQVHSTDSVNYINHRQKNIIPKLSKDSLGKPENVNVDDDGILPKKKTKTNNVSNNHYGLQSKSDSISLEFPKLNSVCCHHRKKEVNIHWTYNTGKCVDASPIVAQLSNKEKIIIVGSHSHKVSAVVASSGQLLWETVLADRVESSACVSSCGQHIVVGCYDGCVYVLQTATGDIVWTFSTSDIVKSSPVVDPVTSYVWFGSHDRNIYSLDIQKKVCILKRNLQSGGIFSSPTISLNPHIVFVSTLDGCLFALNPFDGAIQWQYTFHKPLFTSPCLTSKGVLIGCVNESLYHINNEGSLIWERNTGGAIFSSPICIPPSKNDGQEIIICGSHSHYVFCFTIDGELCWKTNVHSRIYARPSILKNLHLLTFNSKKPLNLPVKRHYQSSVLSDENNEKSQKLNTCSEDFSTIFSTDGNLHIICISCGCVLGDFTLPGEVFSSPLILETNIIVGCRDDCIYCLTVTE
eukprot:XP_014772041.1 PREDICTED: acyl-CoA synthetase family member 4-like [Octopus bimaculoides]